MKTEGLSFPESVEKLAREVGLPVPRATPAERERAERAATLQQVVEQAARWFQKQLRLPVGRHGLDYLRGRGLERRRPSTTSAWASRPIRATALLGGAEARGRADRQDRRGGARHPARGQRREPYDRFRGRVMFPINDRRGRVIAFGGRVMGAGEPKYLNSPETPLFHKGANLYCLDRARVAGDQGPAGDRGRGLHGRDRPARRGLHRRRGAARHGADRRPARRTVEAGRRALSLLRRRQCRPPRRRRAPPSGRCRCCAPARACASSACRPARIPTA